MKTNNRIIVALGEAKHKYQICVLSTDKDGNETAAAVEHIAADTLKQACDYANSKYNKNVCRVYPYCTKTDGNDQLRLAEHTLASFEKWEKRNGVKDNNHDGIYDGGAVMNPFKRTPEDREDYIILACLAINDILNANPRATMHELKRAAFKAIANAQKSNERNAERVYNPGWISCNIEPRTARATIPELDRLFRKAIEKADLTDKQQTAIEMYMDGISMSNVAELQGVTDRAAKQSIYSAEYKIFTAAVALDTQLETFALIGLTGEDIDETAAVLAKRARVKTK